MTKLNPIYWLYKFENMAGKPHQNIMLLCVLVALFYGCLLIITK